MPGTYSWVCGPVGSAPRRRGALACATLNLQVLQDVVVGAALIALIVREGGRTIPAALSEVREAIDFLRYYAARARTEFAAPLRLPGPTG